jgi:hypothetical protein
MYNLQARAYQTRSGIYVTVHGLLADGCTRAKISGTYPGTIIHIIDPGYAEVYIDEWHKHGMGIFCTMGLVPWSDRALIPDFEHKEVAILVNGKKELTVPVQGLPTRKEGGSDWIVIALTGSPKEGPFIGCAIVHKDDIILGIYSQVFGPDTRAACEKFIKANCTIIK